MSAPLLRNFLILLINGGEGGIRTHVPLAGQPDFESGALRPASLPLRFPACPEVPPASAVRLKVAGPCGLCRFSSTSIGVAVRKVCVSDFCRAGKSSDYIESTCGARTRAYGAYGTQKRPPAQGFLGRRHIKEPVSGYYSLNTQVSSTVLLSVFQAKSR